MSMCGGGGGEAEAPLLTNFGGHGSGRAKARLASPSRVDDEFYSFRSLLQWMCLDQTGLWRTVLSWCMFLGLALAVPLISQFVLVVDLDREGRLRHAGYDAVVQLSLSSVSAVSFICLSAFVRRYGLRRFLFIDKLCGESETVRLGYTAELNKSFKLISFFVLPCFVAETAYKIWWYSAGAGRIPFLGNPYVSDALACLLELWSWLYRTAIYFVVCVLFRLICYLQILRLQDFTLVFQEESDVATILAEHLRIRRQLRVISHRFRAFIVTCLLLVTISQLATLLLTTRSSAEVNLFNTGELALCSIGLVTGILICLRSATKITHKAQALTSHAAKWHVCATIDSFDNEFETPRFPVCHAHPLDNGTESDYEEAHDDDELDDITLMQPLANTLSFQKRQALVSYLDNNMTGITLYGFMLDRTTLRMIFGVELPVILWLLGKTTGIS